MRSVLCCLFLTVELLLEKVIAQNQFVLNNADSTMPFRFIWLVKPEVTTLNLATQFTMTFPLKVLENHLSSVS